MEEGVGVGLDADGEVGVGDAEGVSKAATTILAAVEFMTSPVPSVTWTIKCQVPSTVSADVTKL